MGDAKEFFIDSNGTLVEYPDPYKNVSETDVQDLQGFEQFIIEQQDNIKGSFLRIGAALIEIDKRELYKAAGVSTMKQWMESTDFDFSYEHGTRLMRIVRDLVPIIGVEKLPPISTLKEVLPMLTEGFDADEIREAVAEVTELNTKDAQRRLRELRGVVQKESPATFRARVVTGEVFNRVWVTCYSEGGDIYDVTPKAHPLTIKPKDWKRWSDRFGDLVEYE